MRVNKLYRSLLDKSVASMMSAIEIYNKPDFKYREEAFSILAVNSWELLLKAIVLKNNKYKEKSIYQQEPAILHDGSKSRNRCVVKKNRCGNPMSISINEAIALLGSQLPKNLINNIEVLIELRNNAVHFVDYDGFGKQVQEIGYACIKNYILIIKENNVEIDFDKYNLYLMPLALVNKDIVQPVLTSEVKNYLNLVKSKIDSKDEQDEQFDITISIDVNFQKGNAFDSISVRYDPSGLPINLTEDNLLKRYPLTHDKLVEKCRNRYSNYLKNKKFYRVLAEIKKNKKLYLLRKFDPNNPKSSEQGFYSSNVFQELDKHYIRK